MRKAAYCWRYDKARDAYFFNSEPVLKASLSAWLGLGEHVQSWWTGLQIVLQTCVLDFYFREKVKRVFVSKSILSSCTRLYWKVTRESALVW